MLQQQKSNGQPIDEGAREPSFGRQLLTHIRVSVIATIVLAIIVCGIYPVVVWGVSQAIFSNRANGSMIAKDGKPASSAEGAVGSALIGQNFSDARYFHPRPSAAGNGYDATASGGSNLGPTSAKLFNGTTKKDDKGKEVVDFDGLRLRVVHYCDENGIPFDASFSLAKYKDAQGNIDDVKLIKGFNDDAAALSFTPKQPIPADAVTGSGSGLDPHISLENAMLQLPRVATARNVTPENLRVMVDRCTDGPDLGFLGEKGVNVLRLNLALDSESAPAPTTKP